MRGDHHIRAAQAGYLEAAYARPSAWQRWWTTAWQSQTPFWGAVIIFLVALAAILAPLLPIADPNMLDTSVRLLSPFQSGDHPLGTDQVGRDMLARVIWGARVSLAAGIFAALISVGIGALLGLSAGFLGGKWDVFLMRVVDVLMAFPPLVLAVAIVGALGPGLRNALIATGIMGIPLYARMVRSVILVEREMDYVTAARALGAKESRIMWRHAFPATIPVLSVLLSIDVGYKIIVTAGLSFLGLGSQPPTSDWGAMLSEGRAFISTNPHVAIIPGIAIFVVVLALNLLGDGMRDFLDPRTSGVVPENTRR